MSLQFVSGSHPSEPPFSVEGWKGHWLRLLASLVPGASQQPYSVPPTQGMVLSAEYIKKKLEQEMVLSQAFGRDLVSFP